VRYGSIGSLEYEVPPSRLYCLCISVALCSTALQCICRVIRRSSMTMKAHTCYISIGRPLIGGKLPPPGGRQHLSLLMERYHALQCDNLTQPPFLRQTAAPAVVMACSETNGDFCDDCVCPSSVCLSVRMHLSPEIHMFDLQLLARYLRPRLGLPLAALR